MAEQEYLTVGHLNRETLARFFSKVHVNRESGCWEWTAHLNDGYGMWWFEGTMSKPHRIMWAWVFGPIPRGLNKDTPQIDHVVCSNRRCCNPAHLQLVSPKVNALRSGTGFAGVNARKTHCPRGHALPETPDLRYGTARRCLICTLALNKERKRLKRRAEGRIERKPHQANLFRS